MKQSQLTGKFIYETLNRLYKELNELGEACDTVSDELGQQSVAYQILDKSYKEKKQEVKRHEEQIFTS